MSGRKSAVTQPLTGTNSRIYFVQQEAPREGGVPIVDIFTSSKMMIWYGIRTNVQDVMKFTVLCQVIRLGAAFGNIDKCWKAIGEGYFVALVVVTCPRPILFSQSSYLMAPITSVPDVIAVCNCSNIASRAIYSLFETKSRLVASKN